MYVKVYFSQQEKKKVYHSQQECVYTLCKWWMSKSTTVNKNGFPFANAGCQSLLQSTKMGLHPLLMVDVKVITTVNENEFTPFANGGLFLKMFLLFKS